MPRFKIMTRETTYRVHYVDAANLEAASERDLTPEYGDEVEYEFDTVNIEEIEIKQ